jgi:hypothetical protein
MGTKNIKIFKIGGQKMHFRQKKVYLLGLDLSQNKRKIYTVKLCFILKQICFYFLVLGSFYYLKTQL